MSVGGQVSSQEDFTRVIADKLPLFVGMVVLLSALLLIAVFRSVFIPIKAAIMNLLSIGAALGFITLVFQDGFLAGALGVGSGPIEAFVPVMTFAIVFGLSMDYEMFLMSRVREEWLRTGDASLAVRNGVATTGRVVTAAALIMIVVFGSFALGPERVIKEFGLGLAMAVLLDALIIRCLLVPALMQVVDSKAWWAPSGCSAGRRSWRSSGSSAARYPAAMRLRRPAPHSGLLDVKRYIAAGRPGPAARCSPVASTRPVVLRSRPKVAGS